MRALREVSASNTVVEDEGCSGVAFSFCFAAFTLALERVDLVTERVESEADCGSCGDKVVGSKDALELLLAC